MASQNDNSNALGLNFRSRSIDHAEQHVSHVTPHDALRRILNFTGHSIDDLVNSKVAHRTVLVYYRMHKLINRQSEIADLERQWNPLG
jgi:hypothetical protein